MPHSKPDDDWRQQVEQGQATLFERMATVEDQMAHAIAEQAATGRLVKSLTTDVGSALSIHASNAEQLAANTRITLDMKESFEAFKVRAMPAVEVTEIMFKGAALIGNVIEWTQRWGTRLVRLGAIGFAVWLGLKVYFSTGSFAEATRAFLEFK